MENNEVFLELCEKLYDIVMEITENIGNEQPQEKGTSDQNELLLSLTVEQIIEEYNNLIRAKFGEIPQEFQKVFNAAAGIKRCAYQVSHHKRLMRDAERNNNDTALIEASENFIISRKLLLYYYKIALSTAKEALELRNQKKP